MEAVLAFPDSEVAEAGSWPVTWT